MQRVMVTENEILLVKITEFSTKHPSLTYNNVYFITMQ